MVVAGRLEGDLARAAASARSSATKRSISARVFATRSARRCAARQLQQHLVGQLRDVDRYPHGGDVVEEFEVMAGSLLWFELWQTHSREALVLP